MSPYIYGVSHGDVETLHEMGVTARRMGGNLSSVYDWRTGFSSAGADWFFENRKALDTPHPQENWWVVMHRENKKHGMKSFFTLPSEWVAKDDKSSGFPKSVYPDCEQFAGDRPDACNGKSKQKDKEGKPVELRCSKEHPTENGKYVGAEYNVELLKYCIKDAGFGRADQGGIDVVSIDNEPMLYRQTHRDMWCKGWTADDFWEHTKKYAELIRQADPSVKIAAPGLWGWTAYSLSSGDQDYREEHNLGWDKTSELPDFKKYGFFARDFMRRCAEYKKKTGKDLIDIFVFHGYPMTPKLDWGNQAAFTNPTPELQEFRVRDVRKFWDETYRDPDTWMGKEAWSNGNVAYVPLMRRWMKEVGWDAPIAIGEYDHAGPEGGIEVSAAVAQAESFAAFARTQLSHAMYWADPRKHGAAYFAFKMFRNPDGKRTAVGDHFILGEVSDQESVGVYVFKDEQRKVASFVITNKRAKKGAEVKLALSADVPAQKATRYEFSSVNQKAIGELPPLDVSGKSFQVSIAPMSILRVDVKMP
ncbi:MAG: glycoside hydrolase family 44 protein [Polyangiaceae bacterium]